MNIVNMMKSESQEETKTAERILEAAERILAERGYDGLSMRAIGAEVGISQAAIYRHYAGKAELVGALVARGYEGILEGARRAAARGGRADEVLARAMRGYIEGQAKRQELFKAILLYPVTAATAGTAVLGEGVSESRESMALLAALLERGMDEGAFARSDPELSAQAVWAAMYGLAARIILEGMPEGRRRKALIDRQVEIIVGGLGRAAGTIGGGLDEAPRRRRR